MNLTLVQVAGALAGQHGSPSQLELLAERWGAAGNKVFQRLRKPIERTMRPLITRGVGFKVYSLIQGVLDSFAFRVEDRAV